MLVANLYGLTMEDVAAMEDEPFLDAAATAYFLEKRKAETVAEAIMLAVSRMFKD